MATAVAAHPRNDTFPGEVFLQLSVDALELGGLDRDHAFDRKTLQARFLPEVSIRGRTAHLKMDYALNAPAAWRGGLAPDLLDEVAWWQNDDYWPFALYALTIYIRAAADIADQPIDGICRQLASPHQITLE